MSTLSIDPGITSAWAIVNDNWTTLGTGTCQPDELETSLHPDSSRLSRYLIEDVVIEDTPTPTFSEMNRTLIEILTRLRTWYPQARWVRPGVWKNHPVYHQSLPKALSIHEKDAVRLAYYFLATQTSEGVI